MCFFLEVCIFGFFYGFTIFFRFDCKKTNMLHVLHETWENNSKAHFVFFCMQVFLFIFVKCVFFCLLFCDLILLCVMCFYTHTQQQNVVFFILYFIIGTIFVFFFHSFSWMIRVFKQRYEDIFHYASNHMNLIHRWLKAVFGKHVAKDPTADT